MPANWELIPFIAASFLIAVFIIARWFFLWRAKEARWQHFGKPYHEGVVRPNVRRA